MRMSAHQETGAKGIDGSWCLWFTVVCWIECINFQVDIFIVLVVALLPLVG